MPTTHRTNDELRFLGVTRAAHVAISFEAGRHVIARVTGDLQRRAGHAHTERLRIRREIPRRRHHRQGGGREPDRCRHRHEKRHRYQSSRRLPIEDCLREMRSR